MAVITTLGVLGAKYIDVSGRRSEPPAPTGAPNATGAAASPEISGEWQDQRGDRFQIASDGGRITLSAVDNIAGGMTGTGAVREAMIDLTLTHSMKGGTFNCTGDVRSARSIRLSCTNPDKRRYDWILSR